MVYRFGEFAFDDERLELLRSGEPIALEPKPRALLLHLLRRHPTVVGPEEILEAVWPDAVVTRASVARAVRSLRRALGERHDEGSVIRSVRGQGYGIAEEVALEGSVALRPGSAPPDEAPALVGRDEPMRRLSEGLARAGVGRGGVATVAGEAGIGKTRLLAALVDRARVAGWTVLGGRCSEDPGAPALWPWVQVLRDAAAHLPAERIEEALAGRGAGLLRVEPSLRHGGAARVARPGPGDDGVEERFRLFDAADAFLAVLASRTPLLVTIDDLQWADATSLALFEHLARQASGRSLLLLACHRPDPRDALRSLLERIAALPGAQPPVRLGGLSAEHLAEIAMDLLGVSLDDAATADLHARCDGNPFFAIELLRAGEFSADATPERDVSMTSAGGAVPERIRAVVRTRVRALPRDAQSLMDVAAVAGDELSLAVLGRSLDLSEGALLDAIQAAEAAELLTEDGAQPGRFHFVHALIAETLYEALSRRTRMDLHGRVARALEEIHGARPGVHAGALAHHWRHATAAGDPTKAVGYARLAGDLAAEQLAFAEAARCYRQAIDWLTESPASSPAELARLWIARAGAHHNAGEPAAAEQAAWEAIALADAVRSPELVADAAWRLTAGQYRGGGAERLARVLEQAIAIEASGTDGGEPGILSRLWGLLARTLTYSAPFPRIDECSARALALAREAGDPLVELRALSSRDLILASEPRYEERGAISRDRVRLAMELEHPMEEFQARVYRAQRLIQEIDPAAVDEEIRELERLAQELPHSQRCRGFILDLKALRSIWRGEVATARELMPRIEEAWSTVDPLYGMMSLGAKRYLIAGLSGEWDAIDRDEVQRPRGQAQYALPKPYQCALAIRRFELGHEEQAREDFEFLSRHEYEDLQRDATYLVTAVQLALLAHYLGDAKRASALDALLLPYAGRYASGHTTAIRGAVDRYRGLLAWTRGEIELADERLAAAAQQERRMGAPPWEAIVRTDRARLAWERGLADEAARELRAMDALCEGLETAGIQALASPLRSRLPVAG